jgi:hypothetical protein
VTQGAAPGHFAGFSSINERDLPAAIAKLTRH